jgi:hypothetical protein
LEGNPQEPKLVVEDRADPHRHLIMLYIIAIIVSAATAFMFK